MIPARIVLNKRDLASFPAARERLGPYAAIGVEVIELALKRDGDEARERLAPLLAGRATLVLGPSGAGKSTLVNLMVADAKAQIGEISQALNTGRHTTTATQWYWIDAGRTSALIDSPGFQEFGLHHLTEGNLERAFPEFRPLLPNCRFYNCHHLHEPGCAILEAVADGRIRRERHALYAQLVHEASQIVR
jgi:ribosome biogenesis GTPase